MKRFTDPDTGSTDYGGPFRQDVIRNTSGVLRDERLRYVLGYFVALFTGAQFVKVKG